MADNPPDLQAVIPNEIMIISTLKKKKKTIYVCFLSITYINTMLLKYGTYCGFIQSFDTDVDKWCFLLMIWKFTD